MNNYCVYKHTSPSGKVYIGITNQKPTRRWREGEGYRPKEGPPTPFYLAIKKYGWNNIEHEILADGLSREAACALEIEMIKASHARDRAHGYNLLKGGEFVAKYYGALEAERETGVCFQNIFKVCNGERKTAGGFVWRYERDGGTEQ